MNESWKAFVKDHGRVLAYSAAAALVLLAVFLLVKTVDAMDRMGKSPYAGPNVITVMGTGKAETPPTIARVMFTVQETAGTVQAAQDAANARSRTALDAIRALGDNWNTGRGPSGSASAQARQARTSSSNVSNCVTRAPGCLTGFGNGLESRLPM